MQGFELMIILTRLPVTAGNLLSLASLLLFTKEGENDRQINYLTSEFLKNSQVYHIKAWRLIIFKNF